MSSTAYASEEIMAALLLSAGTAAAQDYPSRAVTILVPFAVESKLSGVGSALR